MISRNEQISAKRRRSLERLSIPSQFLHFVDFWIRHPTAQLDRGALITSIDVDVGCGSIGDVNKGKNDINVHGYLTETRVGEIEEITVPLLIEFFDHYEIPVTFAIRGQLTETESAVLPLLLKSPGEHDIGAHGYSHKTFTSLSAREAQSELELISIGMRRFGMNPKSFVFPKNEVAHLPLLEKFGYKCYRGEGGLGRDEMCIRKQGELYDIRPGFHLGLTYDPRFLNKIIDISTKWKAPFHLWFHPRDIYETRGRSLRNNIERVLVPTYKYAKKKRADCELGFYTMCSIVEKLKPKC